MQFRVPQFIDIEDKIFGPFTFRQFVYMVGGAGLAFIAYKALPILFALPIIVAAVTLGGMLTFYRVNNKPFIFILEAWFKYIFQSKLYIWQKRKAMPKAKVIPAAIIPTKKYQDSKLSGNKLRDLAWSLDVLDVGKKQ